MEFHINAKELLVAKFSLKTFVKVSDTHVKLLSDNTTTVHAINNMHSNKSELFHSNIPEIWAWAQDKHIWITASYFPGKENYDADSKSRKKQTELKWMLNQKHFTKIISKFKFQPGVDLFASRLIAQLLVIRFLQGLSTLMVFQYQSRIDPSMHFFPLLKLERC